MLVTTRYTNDDRVLDTFQGQEIKNLLRDRIV